MSKIIDDILAKENQKLKSMLSKAEEDKKELIEALKDGILKWINENTKPNSSRKYSRCPICSTAWWDNKEQHTISCWIPDFNQLLQKYSDKKEDKSCQIGRQIKI